MIIKIATVEPKSGKPRSKIKCKDCEISYSFKEYEVLQALKKLNYLKINDEDSIYCHDCCVKRMVFLKTQFADLVFVLVTASDQKIIDLK